MTDQPTDTDHRLAALEARLKASEEQIEELKRKEKTSVVFTAVIDEGGSYGPFDTDVILTYNTVIVNVGSGYNSSTGVFVAPVAGVYSFSFFYHAGGEHETILHLYRNNDLIVSTSDHQSNVVTSHNGGNSAFMQLDQGDQVYVRMLARSHIWASGPHTTFSGYLVSPM